MDLMKIGLAAWKMWRPELLSLFLILAVAPAQSQSYVVGGFTLGEQIATSTLVDQSFECMESVLLEGYTQCHRVEQKQTSAGDGELSTKVIRAADGTIVYAMVKLKPINIGKDKVESEIAKLSAEMNQEPTGVIWTPAMGEVPASVIAQWGKAEVRRLNPTELSGGDSIEWVVPLNSSKELEEMATAEVPAFRTAGAAGYVYTAGFDAEGRGYRQYIAADMSYPAIQEISGKLEEVLLKDESLAANDYSLWPRVAELIRKMSLRTTPAIANAYLDQVFEKFTSKKLRSHVWSLLPLPLIEHLGAGTYWVDDIYGPDTKYTEIHDSIQKFVTEHPSEPFVELLHYTIGDLDKAIAANPNSVIGAAMKYARGHRILAALLKETRSALSLKHQDEYGSEYTVYWTLNKLDEEPELYGNKPLSEVIPDFTSKAAAARPFFEAVLQDDSAAHQDDAGYMLAWLAVHQGDLAQAKKYLSRTLSTKEGDWRGTALESMMDLMKRSPANEQLVFVESEPPFAREAAPWYFIARASYRNFDYAKTIETGERGLRMLQVPPEDLPATTDPEKITEAIDKILPETRDPNLLEMAYLVEASREILRYDGELKALAGTNPEEMMRKTRAIVTKYSLLLDPEYSNEETSSNEEQTTKPTELIHRDLRQAAHLVDMALAALPRTEEYRALREWLHYRKVRIMVQFAPSEVPGAVSAMAAELPSSQLLDDALGEQLFAQGAVLRDRNAAQDTLQRIIVGFPQGNAVDNALNWMAVIYRCEGLTAEAERMDHQIVLQFSMTRHGRNALLRSRNPAEWNCGLRAFEKPDE